jgi:probable rRNA maturation factor
MTRSRRHALIIDICVESELWKNAGNAKAWMRRALAGAAAALAREAAELAVVLTDDSAIRVLNRQWRGVDAATNVLSFPAPPGFAAGDPPFIGDIVLAQQTIAREAAAERKLFVHHLAHLAVHGYLHLLGYDHDNDKAAATMEDIERNILRRLAIPDPYRRLPVAAERPAKKPQTRR